MQQSLFAAVLSPSPSSSEALSGQHLPAPPTVSRETLLSEAILTVLDLETTGLKAKQNAITEVTAIRFRADKELEKYSTLVKPTEPISAEIERFTGISNAMTEAAPSPVQVLSELAAFVGPQAIVVGHNVSFDIEFIREKLSQNGLSSFLNRFEPANALCTKVLARKIIPGLPSYEGIVVATACGVKNPQAHRAENDVRMTGQMLHVLLQKLQAQRPDIQTIGDLLAFQGSI